MAVRWTRRWFLGGVLAFAAACLPAAGEPPARDKIAAGEGSFEFAPDAKRSGHKLKVWTYRPVGYGPTSPIVIVMHGTKRDGKGYRDVWVPHSREGKFLLVVP